MLVTTSNPVTSSLLRSLGFCSKPPKPIVVFLPEALTFAKSAKFVSIDIIAAQPPSFSKSDILNSLNHTSPQTGLGSRPACLRPTISTRIFPKLGLPFIATRWFWIPPTGNSADGLSANAPSITS